jgi:hypothetical protein
VRILIVAGAALLLSGCFGLGGSRPEPQVRTVQVEVPVPVPCKATVNVHSTYTDDTADKQPDIFEKVKALLIGREERKEDAAHLRSAVAGCGGSVQ